MDSSPPSLRERGIQALRQGDVDGAVDLLARAVLADSQDATAQAFLGVAYSQKGLHAQANRALQTAVELEPTNPSFQFNRGVALEQAGDGAGAAAAYRATLQLNPEHAQARARLQGLGAAGPAAAAVRPPPPPTAPPAAAPGAPWLTGQPAAAAASEGPPGTVQCAHCRQWSKPALSCEWCSSPLNSAPAPSTAPWLQGSYRSVAESGTTSPTPEGAAGQQRPRPLGVSLLVVLYDLGALCSILLSVGVGFGVARTLASPAGLPLGTVMGVFIAATVVMAAVMVTISCYLWKGYNWARIAMIVLIGLGVLGQIFQLLASSNRVIPLLELTVSVLFLVILTSRSTREFCTR